MKLHSGVFECQLLQEDSNRHLQFEKKIAEFFRAFYGIDYKFHRLNQNLMKDGLFPCLYWYLVLVIVQKFRFFQLHCAVVYKKK